jgi:hypothetical protein
MDENEEEENSEDGNGIVMIEWNSTLKQHPKKNQT